MSRFRRAHPAGTRSDSRRLLGHRTPLSTLLPCVLSRPCTPLQQGGRRIQLSLIVRIPVLGCGARSFPKDRRGLARRRLLVRLALIPIQSRQSRSSRLCLRSLIAPRHRQETGTPGRRHALQSAEPSHRRELKCVLRCCWRFGCEPSVLEARIERGVDPVQSPVLRRGHSLLRR